MEKKEYDYKESILPSGEQGRLNELRSIQIDRDFTPDELEEFQRLSREETPELPSEEEKQEYLALTRKQTDSKDWTPDNAKRLRELAKKMILQRALN